MKIVWDEPRRKSNLAKHGLDFASLTIEFFDDSTIFPSTAGRFVAVGNLNGESSLPS